MLSDKSFDWDKIWVAWDLPFQSLIVSSLKSPDSAVTFFLSPDSNIYSPTIFKEANLFVGVPWTPFNFKPNEFPKHYFNLGNTVYKTVNSYQDSSFKSEYFTNDSIELNLDSKEYNYFSNIENKIDVKIKNKSKRVFSSIPTAKNQIFLGYRVIRKSDNKEMKEGRSLIEMDIFPSKTIITPLIIPKNFLDKGIYAVEVGIVEEHKRWIVAGNWITLIMN